MSCVMAAADSCETCWRKDTTAIIRQNDLIECHACWTERYRRDNQGAHKEKVPDPVPAAERPRVRKLSFFSSQGGW